MIKDFKMYRNFLNLLLIFLLSIYKCFSQAVPYNKNYSIACHNCYKKQYAQKIEDVLITTTNIEIDIWDSRWLSGGWKAMNKNWYVKHSLLDKGNNNCCGGSFSDCLKRINAWSDRNPNHTVITVFIDKKENWSEANEARKPNDLDNLLLSIFPKEKIYTPSLYKKNELNLKDASTKFNWPSIDSLKGKIIFVITNGTEITSRNVLDEYLTLQKANSICFVAPEIQNENEIWRLPGFSKENSLDVIFFNLSYPFKYLAKKLNKLNYLSREYGSSEIKKSYDELIEVRVNFIAFYNYKIHL